MTCESRIFDPIGGKQPVFLGMSIVANDGIHQRLGLNEDQSSFTISLVKDDCPPASGTKICYDLQTKAALGAEQNLDGYEFTTADPGFTYPQPGAPVYFRLGDNFSFGGIVQSYTENRSISEYPVFNVTIVDPREILEGCQVIIGSYVGGTYNTPNVFNVYALMETLGNQCGEALLSDFTGPGYFGGAQTNEFGMPWDKIRSGLMFLTAGMPARAGVWSAAGRIQFAGYDYILDISEIPRVSNYRFNSDSLSIADIIREITTFLSMDYYVSLEHVMHDGEVLRAIKVRTISRRQTPDLDSISGFIGNSDGVMESQKGLELRNENTASVLVGGPKIEMFVQTSNHQSVSQDQLYSESSCVNLGGNIVVEVSSLRAGKPWRQLTIAPYWGLQQNGGVILGEGLNMQHNFTVDVAGLNINSINNNLRLTTYNISVEEIHAAMGGKDNWLTYLYVTKPEIAAQLGLEVAPFDFLGVLGGAIINLNNPQKQGGVKPQDLVAIKRQSQKLFNDWYNVLNNQQQAQYNLDALFRLVEHYGSNYYGRRFMIRMFDLVNNTNFVCAKQDFTSGKITFSKEIADAGWIDYSNNFMGLANQAYLDRFRTDDDRIEAFVRFNHAQDLFIPELGTDEYVYQDLGHIETDGIFGYSSQFESQINFALSQSLFIKCQVEPEFVFPSIGCGRFDYSDPRVIINLPTSIRYKQPELTDSIPYFLQFMYRALGGIRDTDDFLQLPDEQKAAVIRDLMNRAGASDVHAGVDLLRLAPNAVCIPLKSNISTYGPWFANAEGLEGKASFKVDESLVPWNYGDSIAMNNAATLLATESLSIMQQSERGSVRVPGLPALNLGDEILSGGSSLNDLRSILVTPEQVENTEFTSARLATNGWEGVSGPNITEIDISISTAGITTSYNMRTYTPSLARNKYFAERIKNRGILAQQNRRRFRGTFERKEDIRTVVTDITNQLLRERQEQKGIFNKSPHSVLVGQNLSYTISNGEYGATEEQTFIRPVVHTQNLMESKSELTDYANKHIASLESLIRPVVVDWNTPINNPGDSTSTNPPSLGEDSTPSWDKYTLNPYMNLGVNNPNNPLGGNNCGHDIEYVTRDDELIGDLNIRNADIYGESYRTFAFRGPMIMTGWGGDLDGKPVPNEYDDPNSELESRTNKFCQNWLRRSDLWKTGPIDFRWDHQREVWTIPAVANLVQARMCNTISEVFGSTGIAVLLNYPADIYEPNEEEEASDCPGPKINVFNTTSTPIRRGANIVCYYYAPENVYWVLEAPAPLYSVYIPDNITPATSTSNYMSGVGYLYTNTMFSFNDHIEPETGSINVFTMNQPIRGGSEAICYERKLNQFWLLKGHHRPLCVVTDVNCEEVYSPDGNTTQLVVEDTTIWLESNWLKLNDGSSTEGGCNTNPAPIDFIGYSNG